MIITAEQAALIEGVNVGLLMEMVSSKAGVEAAEASMNSCMEEAKAALKAAGFHVEEMLTKCRAAASGLATTVAPLLSDPKADIGQVAGIMHESFVKTFVTMYNGISDGNEFSAGLMLFLLILIVNTFAMTLFSVFLGPQAAMMVTSVFVAPIVEESARRQALKQGEGLASLTMLINTYEFTSYVSMMLKAGIKLGVAVAIRGTLAVFHQFLGALQKWGYQKGVLSGESKDEAGRATYVIAILIHVLNNAFGGVFWKAILPKGALGEAVVVGDDVFFT
jgi:hypothetical protein